MIYFELTSELCKKIAYLLIGTFCVNIVMTQVAEAKTSSLKHIADEFNGVSSLDVFFRQTKSYLTKEEAKHFEKLQKEKAFKNITFLPHAKVLSDFLQIEWAKNQLLHMQVINLKNDVFKVNGRTLKLRQLTLTEIGRMLYPNRKESSLIGLLLPRAEATPALAFVAPEVVPFIVGTAVVSAASLWRGKSEMKMIEELYDCCKAIETSLIGSGYGKPGCKTLEDARSLKETIESSFHLKAFRFSLDNCEMPEERQPESCKQYLRLVRCNEGTLPRSNSEELPQTAE